MTLKTVSSKKLVHTLLSDPSIIMPVTVQLQKVLDPEGSRENHRCCNPVEKDYDDKNCIA